MQFGNAEGHYTQSRPQFKLFPIDDLLEKQPYFVCSPKQKVPFSPLGGVPADMNDIAYSKMMSMDYIYHDNDRKLQTPKKRDQNLIKSPPKN